MKKLSVTVPLLFSVLLLSTPFVFAGGYGSGSGSGGASGDIEGVTATAPITGGGTSGTVSVGCQAASGSQPGCLSAADWTTFNGKGAGDASTNTASSVDSEIALFSGTGGKTLKRATGTGVGRVASGVWSAAELSGDVVTSGSNVTTIQPNAVALATDTTGNYAAGDAEAGAALTGDTATAFFSAGQIEAARGGTGDDTSATTGMPRIDAGNWTYAELSGDVVTSGSNATVIQPNAVALATDISGFGSNVATLLATFNLANFNTALSDADVATLTGTETLTNKTLTSPKVGTSILDTNGNILWGVTATASAVNYLQYANAAAGGTPTVTATGSDTDIGELHNLKGLGNFYIKPGTDEVDTLDIQTAAGGHAFQVGTHPGAATFGNIWAGNITPNTTNYALSGDSTSTILNALTSVFFRINGATQIAVTSGAVQLGVDAAVAVPQLLNAHDGTGADKAGADLTIRSGDPTGAGAMAAIKLKTAYPGATSSTEQTATDRMIIAQAKTLTDTAVSLFEIALPAAAMTGGTFEYTIEASDGTDHQSLSNVCTFAVVNKTGTYTKAVTCPAGSEAKSVSSGTLTATFAFADGTNKVTMQVTPVGSLTETTYRISYILKQNAPRVITIL